MISDSIYSFNNSFFWITNKKDAKGSEAGYTEKKSIRVYRIIPPAFLAFIIGYAYKIRESQGLCSSTLLAMG